VRGVRDAAILELLYATGLRVSELTDTNVSDLNLHMGFVKCSGEHKRARIIPLGRPARAALERYLYEERDKLLRNNKTSEKALFLNYYGERLTRQALWKIIRSYAVSAGIGKKITPQILRNSFAVHMILNGADIKSIQELLGHEDISATQIYLSVSKSKIKDVYDSTHPRAR
jgi:integrase/recombinase XerD